MTFAMNISYCIIAESRLAKVNAGFFMMGGYGMMGAGGVFGLLFLIVAFVDLTLVGVWLWQQVNKK